MSDDFFLTTVTGRKGLDDMACKMQDEIMSVAAASVRAAGPMWLSRAIMSIGMTDSLAEVVKTRVGLYSIYKCLIKAATMGLQIGGQFPHAYISAMGGKGELIISADGYKYIACHGPGAVLRDVTINRVYEGDTLSIDYSTGSVTHTYDGATPRGPLKGVYGIMERITGQRTVDYMSREEALSIRDAHSQAYRNGRGPWTGDEDAMVEKTATKRFLRRYTAEAEGVSMGDTQSDGAAIAKLANDLDRAIEVTA